MIVLVDPHQMATSSVNQKEQSSLKRSVTENKGTKRKRNRLFNDTSSAVAAKPQLWEGEHSDHSYTATPLKAINEKIEERRTRLEHRCVVKRIMSEHPGSDAVSAEVIEMSEARIKSRIELDSVKDCSYGWCRVCGVKNVKCCKIFEFGSKASEIINKFLPIKVTREDTFPLKICLECLGILQTMDDLAYRSSLVEKCFQHIHNVDKPAENVSFPDKNVKDRVDSELNSKKAVQETTLNARPKLAETPENVVAFLRGFQEYAAIQEPILNTEIELLQPSDNTQELSASVGNPEEKSKTNAVLNSYVIRYSKNFTPILIPCPKPKVSADLAKYTSKLVANWHSYAKPPYAEPPESSDDEQELTGDVSRNSDSTSNVLEDPQSQLLSSLNLKPKSHASKTPQAKRKRMVAEQNADSPLREADSKKRIEKTQQCYICLAKFPNRKLLLTHIKDSHKTSEKHCFVCEKVFLHDSIQPLLKHRKIHQKEELEKWTLGSDCESSPLNLQCGSCKKFLNSRIHKLFHDIYHHNLRILSCDLCDDEFFSEETLSRHHDACNVSNKNYQKICHICSVEFTDPISFKNHCQSHLEPYSCDDCLAAFASNEMLNEHISVDHAEKPYPCEICGKSFTELSSLTQHGEWYHTDNFADLDDTSIPLENSRPTSPLPRPIFNCFLCKEVCTSEAKLRSHHKQCLGDKKPCYHCGEIFDDRDFYPHKREKHSEKFCHICKSECSSDARLAQHLKKCLERAAERKNAISQQVHVQKRLNPHRVVAPRKRPPRISVCKTCHRQFPNRSALRSHESIHVGLKPHMCEVCGKTYRTTELLYTHSLRHAHSRTYSCEFCELGFRTMELLYNHKREYHIDRFAYNCKTCKNYYNSRKHFVIHTQICSVVPAPEGYLPPSLKNLKSGTSLSPVQEGKVSKSKKKKIAVRKRRNLKNILPETKCMLCYRWFSYKLALSKHEAIKHDERFPPVCKMCNEQFPTIRQLKKHIEWHFHLNEIKNIPCPRCQEMCVDDSAFKRHVCQVGTDSAEPTQPTSADSSIPSNAEINFSSQVDGGNENHTSETAAVSSESKINSAVTKETHQSDAFSDALKSISEQYPSLIDSPRNTNSFSRLESSYNQTASLDLNMLKAKSLESEDLIRKETRSNSLEETALSLQSVEGELAALMNNCNSELKDTPPELIRRNDTNLTYHCGFCGSDFTDSAVFEIHLKNEHGGNLEDFDFQFFSC